MDIKTHTTFNKHGIIETNIDPNVSNKTYAEVSEIIGFLNQSLAGTGCQVVVNDMELCFLDPYGDYYRINEPFDTTIY